MTTFIRTHKSGFTVGTIVLAVAFALVAVAVGTHGVLADHGGPYGDEEVKKVVLCHWDESGDGAYKSSGDVSVNAAINSHGNIHPEDIVPPFHYKDGGSYPGQNWDSEGEDIWGVDGSCDGADPEPTTGTLVIVKTVVNDDEGTAVVGDFSFSVGDQSDIASEEVVELEAGDYSVSEDGPDGYTASDWGGDCDADGNITIVAGESYECTITNDDNSVVEEFARVTICKEDGSETPLEGWEVFIENDLDTQYGDTTGEDGCVVVDNVPFGDYTLGETLQDGWTNVSGNGDDVVVDEETETFTLVNRELPDETGFLVVIKNVISGLANPSDFIIDIFQGENLIESDPGSSTGVVYELGLGDYIVDEQDAEGYTVAYTGDCAENGTVSVLTGATSTCTVQNREIPSENGSIHGIKLDNQENGVMWWGVRLYQGQDVVASTDTMKDDPETEEENEAGMFWFEGVEFGDYVLCEENRANWTQVVPGDGPECPNGTVGFDVTVDGEETGFVFQNRRSGGGGGGDKGSIHGTKYNNATEAGIVDWTVLLYQDQQVVATTTTMTDDPETEENEEGMYWFTDVDDGNYIVCEVLEDDWKQVLPTEGEGNPICPNETIGYAVSIDGASISEENDFWNVHDPQIIVDKVTNPSESDQEFEFVPSWTENFSLTDTAEPHNSGDLSAQLDEGNPFSVSENVPDGWQLDSAVCDSSLGHDETPDAINLDPGEVVTCTFTNSEEGGSSGGGGGGGSSGGGGGGISGGSAPDPEPEVLGEQIAIVPQGAPNTGMGGTAATASTLPNLAGLFSLLLGGFGLSISQKEA